MENLLSSLVGFSAWLFRNSFQASVVIGLVLLAQWVFRKKLSPRWRYALWSLVLLRLMLPVSPQSAFSIFNYAKGANVFVAGTAAGSTGYQPVPSGDSPDGTKQTIHTSSAEIGRAHV